MTVKTLSSNERKLIMQISQLMINSYLTNASTGHQVFDEFIDEFEDMLEDANKLGIAIAILEDVEIMEKVKENPLVISALRNYHLTIVKAILEDVIKPDYKPITRKKLLKKVNLLLSLSNQQSNLN